MIPNDIQLVTSNPTSGKITNIDEFIDAEVIAQGKSTCVCGLLIKFHLTNSFSPICPS